MPSFALELAANFVLQLDSHESLKICANPFLTTQAKVFMVFMAKVAGVTNDVAGSRWYRGVRLISCYTCQTLLC